MVRLGSRKDKIFHRNWQEVLTRVASYSVCLNCESPCHKILILKLQTFSNSSLTSLWMYNPLRAAKDEYATSCLGSLSITSRGRFCVLRKNIFFMLLSSTFSCCLLMYHVSLWPQREEPFGLARSGNTIY